MQQWALRTTLPTSKGLISASALTQMQFLYTPARLRSLQIPTITARYTYRNSERMTVSMRALALKRSAFPSSVGAVMERGELQDHRLTSYVQLVMTSRTGIKALLHKITWHWKSIQPNWPNSLRTLTTMVSRTLLILDL